MLQTRYIRVSYARSVLFFARSVLFLVIWLALVAFVACSNGNPPPDEGESSSSGGNSSGGNSSSIFSSSSFSSSSGGGSSSSENNSDGESSSSNDSGTENAIKIEYKNGSAPAITNPFSEVTITPTGENIVVELPNVDNTETVYTFDISGTASNGSVKFYGNVRKMLNLKGVNITNSTGPAINIQGGKRTNINLVNGTQNFLTDGPNYNITPGEQAKGTLFSEGKLEFEGNGSLEVKAKYNHAIVADNSLEIKSGNITVSEAANDGIHANDKIEVKGGNITIKSVGDAIQSEDPPPGAVDEWVAFSGGKINAQTTGIKSHGIASEGPITIKDNADITISVSGNGSKGIRSRSWVELLGGKTSITTTGTTDKTDQTDESNATGMKLATELFLKGGELTIKTTGDGAKGINIGDNDAPGNASLDAGKIDINADDDGLRVHGILKIKSGITGSIKSKKQKAINADEWDKNKGSLTTQDGGS